MRCWKRLLYRTAKRNAGKRQIPFDLAFEEFEELIDLSAGRCMLTGIEFDNSAANGKRRPFAASLDRIDSSQSYHRGNVRLVCCAVNLAMNEWGLDTLKRVAEALLDLEFQRHLQAEPQDVWVRTPRKKDISLAEYLAERGIVVDSVTKGRITKRVNNACWAYRVEHEYDEVKKAIVYPRALLDREARAILEAA